VAGRARRQQERLAIPADARGEVATAPARGGVLTRRPFDAPVVRQVEPPPLAIVEPRLLGARGIAEGEAPARVHRQALALARRRRGRKRQSRQADDERARHLVLLREAEPPRDIRWRLRADSVEFGLDIERDMETLEIEELGELLDGSDRPR
jgi:hypothetical protein